MQGGLGVDRAAVDVDLEMEMATDGAGVAGLADGPDVLPRPDAVATVDGERVDQMSVEVAPRLTLAVDQEEISVEDGVIANAKHPPRRRGDQGRTAGGDDVEAFMGTATAAGRPKLADRAARPVRALDREDVGVVGGRAVAAGDLSRRGSGDCSEENEGEKERVLQWCSITRSTTPYSFASSALMK